MLDGRLSEKKHTQREKGRERELKRKDGKRKIKDTLGRTWVREIQWRNLKKK